MDMQAARMSRRGIFTNLFVYGTLHALVDAICVGVVFTIFARGLVSAPDFYRLIVLYGFLAFALQAALGLLVDHCREPRGAALLGCALAGCSALSLGSSPLAAVILAGLGNALFHIGGGTIALNLTPKRATAPGIFVAPGALGLFAGTVIGKGCTFLAWPFLLALLILCAAMFIVKMPAIDYRRREKDVAGLNYFKLIFVLIFLAVIIRSLVGFSLVFPWKTDPELAVLLTLGIVLGKASGGMLADRFGWTKVAVGASLLSVPLLVSGADVYYLAIAGIFLFNMTMPITMTALANMFPGRPAFAFGLTCLALFLGALPMYAGHDTTLGAPFLVAVVIVTSASFLNTGLQLLLKNELFAFRNKT